MLRRGFIHAIILSQYFISVANFLLSLLFLNWLDIEVVKIALHTQIPGMKYLTGVLTKASVKISCLL